MLEDWRTAPVSERLRAGLGFLSKYVLPEEDFGAEDIEAMRTAGLSDQEIKDVMYVGFCFMMMSKAADAFGWPPHDDSAMSEKGLNTFYNIPYKALSLIG